MNIKIATGALALLLAGSLAGFVAHETILKAAKPEFVPSSKAGQLEAEIKTLKEEKTALEAKLASTSSPPPPDPNERVLYYKTQIVILRGNIEGFHNTLMDAKKNTLKTDPVLQDNILRQRARELANLIGEIAEDQLRPAIKIIKHEYGGWAYLMAGSSYGEAPPKFLSAEVRIDYATKAVAQFNLALDRMDDIKSKSEAGDPEAIPINKWMTGDSQDVNRTHYLKAIALAVLARAGGGAPQAAIVELNEFVAHDYLNEFPAAANPDLAWALSATSTVNDPE